MKKLCATILAILICCFLVVGCSGASDDSIVGTWKGVSTLTKGNKFVFHEDGSLDMLRENADENVIGKYIYETEGDTVTTQLLDDEGERVDGFVVPYVKQGRELYFEDELVFVKQ